MNDARLWVVEVLRAGDGRLSWRVFDLWHQAFDACLLERREGNLASRPWDLCASEPEEARRAA